MWPGAPRIPIHPPVVRSRWSWEDGMRPNRRWWVFIPAMALTWGGWWWLEVRQPWPGIERPTGGAARSEVARRVDPAPERPGSEEPSGDDHAPGEGRVVLMRD